MTTETKSMSWSEITSGLAQGAINISEGLTTIETGSRTHRAMLAFCERFTAIERGTEGLPPQFQPSAAHLSAYERE